jgi:hypothetical protein
VSSSRLEHDLSRREKARLGLEILRAYARVRWLLWRTDLPSTLAALRAGATEQAGDTTEAQRAGVRLGRAVGKAMRPLPFDSRCLMRSLVLTRLLAERGIDSSLVIAVRPESEFLAHAWVERDGVPLLDPAGPPFSRLVEL